jgi:uncharacterized membrane protein
MQVLRFLMLLSLVVWIGGIIFFAIVAPVAFSVVPTHQLAGNLVGRLLTILHWMGLSAAVTFLIASTSYSRLDIGFAHPFAARNLLIIVMVVLTLVSMFVVTAKMDTLRTNMGVIDNVPLADSRRVEFDALHQWSTRLEIGVLAFGLAVLFLTSKTISH